MLRYKNLSERGGPVSLPVEGRGRSAVGLRGSEGLTMKFGPPNSWLSVATMFAALVLLALSFLYAGR
jgi:hypothetical protein